MWLLEQELVVVLEAVVEVAEAVVKPDGLLWSKLILMKTSWMSELG